MGVFYGIKAGTPHICNLCSQKYRTVLLAYNVSGKKKKEFVKVYNYNNLVTSLDNDREQSLFSLLF